MLAVFFKLSFEIINKLENKANNNKIKNYYFRVFLFVTQELKIKLQNTLKLNVIIRLVLLYEVFKMKTVSKEWQKMAKF